MIYLKDIHKCDDQFMADKEYMETAEFIESCVVDSNLAVMHAQALEEFGLFTEEAKSSSGSAIASAIKALGNKIMELVNKLKETVRNIVNDWKAKVWESKSKEQQLREVIRKYPNRANEITAAVKREDLSFATYKDLEEFYKSSDEILSAIEKGNVDPKSLRGKWEATKKKINDNERLIQTTIAVLGFAATTAGLVLTYKKWKSDDMTKTNACIENYGKRVSANAEILAKSFQQVDYKYSKQKAVDKNNVNITGKSHRDDIVGQREKAALVAEILNEVQKITGISGRKAKKLYGDLINQFLTKIDGTIDPNNVAHIAATYGDTLKDGIKNATNYSKLYTQGNGIGITNTARK